VQVCFFPVGPADVNYAPDLLDAFEEVTDAVAALQPSTRERKPPKIAAN
jgi:hypothetical protein